MISSHTRAIVFRPAAAALAAVSIMLVGAEALSGPPTTQGPTRLGDEDAAPVESSQGDSPGETPTFKTGWAMQQQLEADMDAHWKNVPLRKALESLARTQQVGIMLDRRVNPDQLLRLTVVGVPLSTALARIAHRADVKYCVIDSLVYIAPEQTVGDLPTVAELLRDHVRRLPSPRRAALMQVEALSWPALTTPREIFDQLANRAELEIENREDLPHDLWPAVDLPPLPLIDRMTVVLAGFDLTLHLSDDGKSARIVPIQRPVRLVRTYRLRSSETELLTELRRIGRAGQIQIDDDRVVFAGRTEDHQRIAALLSGSPQASRKPAGPGRKVFTTTVKNQPVGAVIRQIAQRLGLEVRVDRNALDRSGLSMQRRVSFAVTQAATEQLLDAALRPAGLSFEVRDKLLIIQPAGQKPTTR